MISGLSNGFHLSFNPLAVSLKSASQNMPSASLQPSVIDQYLHTELEKGHVAGPFSTAPIPNLSYQSLRYHPLAGMSASTLHLGCFSGCHWIWVFLFGALASRPLAPLFSEQCLACSEVLWLGMGDHGWVASICQPWEWSPSGSWLPTVEAPGCLRHPTSTL